MKNLTITQRVKKIENLANHPNAANHEDVYLKLNSLYREIKYERPHLIYGITNVIRATCNLEESWFDNISKFSYPPADAIKKFGRCNWPGEPVFYCSNETGVPIFEVRPEVGSFVALSKWSHKTQDNLGLNGIVIGSKAIADSPNTDNDFRNNLNIYMSKASNQVREADEYMSALFTEKIDNNERLYWLTSALSKICLEKMTILPSKEKLNSLIYPSIASSISGFNIAISKNFVDDNLRLKSVIMYQIYSFDKKRQEYKLFPIKRLVKSTSDGKNLKWDDVRDRYSGNPYILNPQTPTVEA